MQEWYLWEMVSCLEVSSGGWLAVSRLCKHPSCDCVCVYTSKLNALLRVGNANMKWHSDRWFMYIIVPRKLKIKCRKVVCVCSIWIECCLEKVQSSSSSSSSCVPGFKSAVNAWNNTQQHRDTIGQITHSNIETLLGNTNTVEPLYKDTPELRTPL